MGQLCARSERTVMRVPQVDAGHLHKEIFNISYWDFPHRARSSGVKTKGY